MQFVENPIGQADQIVQLFKDTFTASEGEEEGALIGDLAHDLLSKTPRDDIRVFTSQDGDVLRACAIFTRLRFERDQRKAFLLSPMAVASDCQGKGIGQRLLNHALRALQGEGADIAITYGDPGFYGRVGFVPVTTETVPAPLPLSMPQGWIAQSLTDAPLTPLAGPSVCVPALNRPEVW